MGSFNDFILVIRYLFIPYNNPAIHHQFMPFHPDEIRQPEIDSGRIDWDALAIVTYDYEQLYKNKHDLHKELISKVLYIDRMFIPEIAQMIVMYMH